MLQAILIDRDGYILELRRYLHLNPVRAVIVKHSGTYKWGSYKATAGLVKKSPFLTVDWILGQFGKKLPEAQKEYRRFIQASMKVPPAIWEELKAQCIPGSNEFIEKLKPALKEKSKIMEIPKEQRLAFRPSLK